MKLTCNDTLYTYDAYHLLKAFYPDEEIEQQVDEEQESQIRIESDCDSCFCVTLAGEKTELLQMDRGEKKHLAVRSLYEKLCRATKKSLPWGSLLLCCVGRDFVQWRHTVPPFGWTDGF